MKKVKVNRSIVIEQIIERLNNSAPDALIFQICRLLFGTNYTTNTHKLKD